MSIWQPDPGETLLARAPVTFATGAATRVRGMRWFRDPERNDIQHLLPGWPEGPAYTARSASGAVTDKSLRAAAAAAGGAVMAFLSSAGGNVTGGNSSHDEGSGTPEEPADEVEDFPVMWAGPGTMARTLPWQLDPGRADQKHHITHLILTDRRLVVVRLPYDKRDLQSIDDEAIWECLRSDVNRVELKNFKSGEDFKVLFVDGSWCRLHCKARRKLTRYMAPPRELIPLELLSPPQRATVSDFVTERGVPDTVSLIITRNPTGRIRVEALLPSRFTSAFGASEVNITMEPDGSRVDIGDYLPEDF